MKISSAVFLSGVLLVMGATPLCAQHYHGMSLCSCPQQQGYDAAGVKSDEQEAIEELQKRCNAADHRDKSLEFSRDYLGDILELQDKLKQTELRLYTAEVRIETLQNQVSANQEHMEEEFTALLMARRPASKPKAPVSQAKPVDSPKD